MDDEIYLELLAGALPQLHAGFSGLPVFARAPARAENAAVLHAVAERLHDNYPYFHPLYAGQMLKPPHPVAQAAYALAMSLNPNNHALDGGRASSAMELEAVRALAGLVGWSEYLGHLTSGGTFANLEALWVAGLLAPGKRVLASSEAHYTHARMASLLQLPFAAVPADGQGRMDTAALEAELAAGDVGTVVVTLGTTGVGAVDPLDQVLALRSLYRFRIHVDAAYGGYFILAPNLAPEVRRAYASLHHADSVVIDPHKHGLQPYGCGCVLFRDPAVGRFYKHTSPYTYFTSDALHLGEISLECSRAGAAATALWATQQAMPMTPGGEFAHNLGRCRDAALALHTRLLTSEHFACAFAPQLDIVVWAVRSANPYESSALAEMIFQGAAARDLHLALVTLPIRFFPDGTWLNVTAEDTVTCFRSVLMKPEHLDWIPEIWKRLKLAAEDCFPGGNPS